MSRTVSVILPTHAPHEERLRRTLEGLRAQLWPRERWELLLIDNASPDPSVFAQQDLTWQPRARIICEERLGLTHARLAGIRASAGDILLFVDDDNVLDPTYIQETVAIFTEHSALGAAGGKSLPAWEVVPDVWVHEFASCLAVRDLGDHEQLLSWQGQKTYPDFAPVGAGMALDRAAAEHYARSLADSSKPTLLDRCGPMLSSGGDNDIILTILASGWRVGYFPRLRLTHLIPSTRLTREYLARINRSIARSWVQVLDRHGIRPWSPIPRWSILPRKMRAFWRYRAWRNPSSYVRWRGACGTFEGRADITR